MAKKKGRTSSVRAAVSNKAHIVEAWCTACAKETPIVHVQTISLKKRWSWNCLSCNSEVQRRR